MAKNLVNGTNIIIEESGDNINMNLSSTYNTNLQQEINDSFKKNNIYSTTEEQVIGTWINGKPIYRKVVNMGNLLNNGGKSVKHGLSNFVITTMNGSATNGSTYIGISGFNDEIYIDNTNIIWTTRVNRSSYTAYVVLEYIKTTD